MHLDTVGHCPASQLCTQIAPQHRQRRMRPAQENKLLPAPPKQLGSAASRRFLSTRGMLLLLTHTCDGHQHHVLLR